MKTPKWLRHRMAKFLAWRADEYGGMLLDYANGQWEEIARWETQKDSDAAVEIVENMMTNGRDGIYVALIKVGHRKGYFIVETSDLHMWVRGFWAGIYELDEAFVDVKDHCRKLADEMGFRRPDEQQSN